MGKFILLCIILSGYYFQSNAQETFQKTFGGTNTTGRVSCATADGGCIVTGFSSAFGNNTKICAARLDSAGAVKWSRIYGTGLNNASLINVLGTDDDGFIGCGEISQPSLEGDILVMRCDSTGDTVWTRTFNYKVTQKVLDFSATPDSCYIIFGRSAPLSDYFFLVKIDQAGNVLWTKSLKIQESDDGKKIRVTTDGSILISFTVSFPFYESALIKISSQGSILWAKKYGKQGKALDLYSMAITSDGGCILSGFYDDDIAKLAVVRIDQQGDTVWSNKYSGYYLIQFYSLIQTTNNNFITAGYYFPTANRDVLVFHFDSSGNPIHTNIFGRPDVKETAISIVESKDGGFFVTGYDLDSIHQTDQMYLAKIDMNGDSKCQDQLAQINKVGPVDLQISSFQQTINDTTIIRTYNTVLLDSGYSITSICSSIGIDETNGNPKIQIFPNPSNGIFNITFSENNPYDKLIIFNSTGEIVLQNEMHGEQKIEVNLSANPNGIYFVRFVSAAKYQAARICLAN